jgi:hypothetical protein
MQYQIKELSIGGILDQTVVLLKNHFGLLMGIVVVFYLPFLLLQSFVGMALLPEMPATPTAEDFRVYQEATAEAAPYTVPLLLLFAFVIVPITNAALIDAVARCYLGSQATIGSSYSYAIKVLLPLLWTWFLQMLAIGGGFMLLIIPGIICMFWFSLSSHTVVVGGEKGFAALKRSRQLMKGNIGTMIALGLIIGIIQWGIAFGAALLPQQHIRLVAQAFAGSVGFLFSAVAFVVFYFSCRCKNENFDLTHLAESFGEEESLDAEPAM